MEMQEELDQTTRPSPRDELCETSSDSGITLALENEELWTKFRDVDTEMLLTRQERCMFPWFCVSAVGLDLEQRYAMELFFKSDDKRYKYYNSNWVSLGKADNHIHEVLSYKHPDSGSTGISWMYNKISFRKVKLTSSKAPKNGQIHLYTMHKYVPCVLVSKYVSEKKTEIIHMQEFPQAAFIPVTAYHSEQVLKLKIETNPRLKSYCAERPVRKEMSRSSNGSSSASDGSSSASHSPLFLSPSYSPLSHSPHFFSPSWYPIFPFISPPVDKEMSSSSYGSSSASTSPWPFPFSPSRSPLSPLISPRCPPTSLITNPLNVTFPPISPTVTGNTPLPQSLNHTVTFLPISPTVTGNTPLPQSLNHTVTFPPTSPTVTGNTPLPPFASVFGTYRSPALSGLPTYLSNV